MKSIKYIGSVVVSFGLGLCAGYHFAKARVYKKEAERTDKEIKELKEHYKARYEEREVESGELVEEPEKKETSEEDMNEKTNIYIITEKEFHESEYDAEYLDYYADGYVADQGGIELENIENTIGEYALDEFSDFNTDEVYICNELLKKVYLITRCPENYLPEDEDDYDDVY